jgi:glucose/arabinose dehydrogenase
LPACNDDDDEISLQNRPRDGAGGTTTNAPGQPPSSATDAGVEAPGRAYDGGAREVFRPDEVAPPADAIARLSVPSGFALNVFADDLEHARMLAPLGDAVYVTRPEQGDVLRLVDDDGDGVSDQRTTAVSGLTLVHGIVFRGADVYLATPTEVYQATVAPDGTFTNPTAIIDDLPDGGQHPLRTLGIGPDDALYISVGSSCDACDESNPEHATILRAALDGSSRTTFASGLRNTIGFGWHPETSVLWGMDHGSDWRGNDLPPEELNRIEQGNDYGWPYCFGERQVDPVIQDPPDTTKAAYCAETASPVLQTQAHNAPIGFSFYTGSAFPSEYQGDAFVALRGSWNRFPPTGYKIARVVFEGGEPQRFEDFVTGFLSADGTTTFARPAGIAVASDGALLFTDDSNGVIYRVSNGAAGDDAGAAPPAPAADAGVADAG